MRSKTMVVLVVGLLYSMGATGQAQNSPAMDKVATAIPGVIAAGAKIEVLKDGFKGTEGPIGFPDGSLVFTENATQ